MASEGWVAHSTYEVTHVEARTSDAFTMQLWELRDFVARCAELPANTDVTVNETRRTDLGSDVNTGSWFKRINAEHHRKQTHEQKRLDPNRKDPE